MKIAIISDTHTKHRALKIPEADAILCAGDISFKGELSVIEDFAEWMGKLPIQHKITIFGNHELGMEKGPKRPKALKMLQDNGITYLEDSGITIDGVNFWGSPIQPWFHNWEWNRQRGAQIKKHWDLIPDDTNVLITHGPPYNILDIVPLELYEKRDPHQGCEELAQKVLQLPNLKLHCFGHLHTSGGQTITQNGVIFANAAVCTEQYQLTNPPIVVEL